MISGLWPPSLTQVKCHDFFDRTQTLLSGSPAVKCDSCGEIRNTKYEIRKKKKKEKATELRSGTRAVFGFLAFIGPSFSTASRGLRAEAISSRSCKYSKPWGPIGNEISLFQRRSRFCDCPTTTALLQCFRLKVLPYKVSHDSRSVKDIALAVPYLDSGLAVMPTHALPFCFRNPSNTADSSTWNLSEIRMMGLSSALKSTAKRREKDTFLLQICTWQFSVDSAGARQPLLSSQLDSSRRDGFDSTARTHHRY